MPPPRANVSKTNPNRIKEPNLATKDASPNLSDDFINLRRPPGHNGGLFTTMKITSIVAFEDSILFNVDEQVPAYKADENGAMTDTTSDNFSMSYADLARQIYPLNADIAELRALRGQHLSGEDWIKLLTGATITVDFTFHNANDEVDGYTYENTGYVKTIKKVTLTDRVAARLDRALGF